MKQTTKIQRKISKISNNSSHNPNQYRSSSNQKVRKQNYSSYLFENAKNSLCGGSPKILSSANINVNLLNKNNSNLTNNKSNANINGKDVNNLICTQNMANITQNQNNNHKKYQSYMQFMESEKINNAEDYLSQLNSKRNSFAYHHNLKRKTATPTPRRNSLQHTDRKKLSVMQNFNNLNTYTTRLTDNTTRLSHNLKPYSQTNRAKCHSAQPQLKSSSINFLNPNQNVNMTKKMNAKNQLFIKGRIINSQLNSYGHQEKQKQTNKKKQNLKFKSKKKLAQGKSVKPNNNKKNQKEKERKSHKNNVKNSNSQTLKSTLQADQKLQMQEQKLLTKLFKGIQFHRDLGKGAHALVKSAVDWNNNRKIAIKIYNRNIITSDEIKNIQRQVQILMSLNHQNIIKLYEIMESYKSINLIMQYGGGNSLDQFIRSKAEGKLNQNQSSIIFKQVLNAAAYLQQMNIVHRDLKPENILLNKYLHVKIIDFGFSLRCGKDQQISTFCGTPTYMAPQVVSKIAHNPHLSDRWSLGILLYTMLNGTYPFKATTQKQLFQKINNGQFTYMTDITQQAKQLIDRFLCKNPNQRITPADALQSQWVKKFSKIIQKKQIQKS